MKTHPVSRGDRVDSEQHCHCSERQGTSRPRHLTVHIDGAFKLANPLASSLAASYTESMIVDSAQALRRKGETHAVNRYPPDQSGDLGTGIHRECAGVLSHGAGGCREKKKRAAPGDDSRLETLVSSGERAD